jgi:hypothetical protein
MLALDNAGEIVCLTKPLIVRAALALGHHFIAVPALPAFRIVQVEALPFARGLVYQVIKRHLFILRPELPMHEALCCLARALTGCKA